MTNPLFHIHQKEKITPKIAGKIARVNEPLCDVINNYCISMKRGNDQYCIPCFLLIHAHNDFNPVTPMP